MKKYAFVAIVALSLAGKLYAGSVVAILDSEPKTFMTRVIEWFGWSLEDMEEFGY